MQNQAMLYGVIGLLVGVLVTTFAASNAVNTNNTGMMRMMGMRMPDEMEEKMEEEMEEMHEANGMDMSMNDMTENLKGKTGDEFDKAFIEGMIIHHQGAIDMANLAKTSAKHDEIKNLADGIIKAQSSEIEMMKTWQKNWGY